MPPHICVIPGDGCGHEVTAESLKILDILSERGTLEYDVFHAGAEHYESFGESWEEGTMDAARESDAILFGAVGKEGVVKPDGTRPASEVIFGLRNGLDLYANVRPVKLFPGIEHMISGERKLVWKPDDVDIIIVRELTEGLYVRIGGEVREGELAIDNRITTETGSWRIVEFAANLALSRNERKHLTCVDKSNVLIGDRLFRRVFDEVVSGPQFSDLTTGKAYVDAMAMFLMTNPERYDILVAPNLYGDILSDLASVLAGGIGMAPSGSYGLDNAMFEPIHGSAPDIAGQGIVNPSASLLSTAMMLEYLATRSDGVGSGGAEAADLRLLSEALEDAVKKVIVSGVRTIDIGGTATTSEFGNAVKNEFLRIAQIRC
jgi:3-isopropylmalate dehydrogenase